MAFRELVILSSSPTHLAEDTTFATSSHADTGRRPQILATENPEQYAVELPRAIPKLKTGSRSTEAPKGANLGFVRAALILQEQAIQTSAEASLREQDRKAEDKERATKKPKRNLTENHGSTRPRRSKEKSQQRRLGDELFDAQECDATNARVQSVAIDSQAITPEICKDRRLSAGNSTVDLPSVQSVGKVATASSAERACKDSTRVNYGQKAIIFKDGGTKHIIEAELPKITRKTDPAEKSKRARQYLSSIYIHDSDSNSETASIATDTDKPDIDAHSRDTEGQAHIPAFKSPLAPFESLTTESATCDIQLPPLRESVTVRRPQAKKSRAKAELQPKARKRKTVKVLAESAVVEDAIVEQFSATHEKKATKAVSKHFAAPVDAPNDILNGVPGQNIITFATESNVSLSKSDLGSQKYHTVAYKLPDATAEVEANKMNQSPEKEIAMTRRLSWTPKRDTIVEREGDVPSASAIALETSNAIEKASFKTLLSNFAYGPPQVSPSSGHRDQSEKASINKRKRELIGRDTQTPAKRKPKATKKKIKTITGLATEKYLPIEQNVQAQGPVEEVATANTTENTSSTPYIITNTKSVKKRNTTRKRPAKPKKENSKSSAAALKMKSLLAPAQALADLRGQDILFGTSSQLAQEDNPSFIRDLQHAMRASEDDYFANKAFKNSPDESTKVNVRRAQIKKKDTGIWNAGNRNFEGGLLNPFNRRRAFVEEHDIGRMDGVDASVLLTQVPAAQQQEDEDTSEGEIGDRNLTENALTGADTETGVKPFAKDNPTSVDDSGDELPSIAAICDDKHQMQSPVVNPISDNYLPSEDYGFMTNVDLNVDRILTQEPDSRCAPIASNADGNAPSIDCEKITTSQHIDTRDIDRGETGACKMDESGFVDIDDLLSPHLAGSSPQSSLRSLPTTPTVRKALLTIPSHPNIPSPTKKQSTKPFSTFTKASLQAPGDVDASARPQVRPRGRPRGRPRKKVKSPSSTTDAVETQNQTAAMASVSPRRTKPKKVKINVKKADEWTHIDEISDSEAECTPSPPRNVISASQTLEFTSDSGAATMPEDGQTRWSASKAILYEMIVTTIRKEPRTEDPSKPTWHEKILLYDPIVLEDLTAWLNSQGVRLPSTMTAQTTWKAKKRQPMITTDDYTLVKEWMVQKWCEDSSICCLWKGGLRGGVRNRY